MHKHRLAQAGLFSRLSANCVHGYFLRYGPKIQNQRGMLLAIYVRISSALHLGSVKRAFAPRANELERERKLSTKRPRSAVKSELLRERLFGLLPRIEPNLGIQE